MVDTQPCAAEANGKTLPNSSGAKSSHNLAKPSGLMMLSMSLCRRFLYPIHLPEPLSQLRGSLSFVACTALLLATQQLFSLARSSLPPKRSQAQDHETSQARTRSLPSIFY